MWAKAVLIAKYDINDDVRPVYFFLSKDKIQFILQSGINSFIGHICSLL